MSWLDPFATRMGRTARRPGPSPPHLHRSWRRAGCYNRKAVRVRVPFGYSVLKNPLLLAQWSDDSFQSLSTAAG